jgi:hypothetical protein
VPFPTTTQTLLASGKMALPSKVALAHCCLVM